MHLFNNGVFNRETMANHGRHGTHGKGIVGVAVSGEVGSRAGNVVNGGGRAGCFARVCVCLFLAAEERGMTRNDVTSDCAGIRDAAVPKP